MVLIECEGILNSKPLGYVSSDVADIDPVMPAVLLMGRRDVSLPQVVYPATEILGRHRWRHSQILADQFWSNFIKYYLPSLRLTSTEVAEGESGVDYGRCGFDCRFPASSCSVAVGNFIETFPGSDGCARTASIQVCGKNYVRPLAKLI